MSAPASPPRGALVAAPVDGPTDAPNGAPDGAPASAPTGAPAGAPAGAPTRAPAPVAARVPALVRLRVFWRALFLQAAWNPHGMQNLGFAYAMAPALRALYPEPQARLAASRRHLEFFNCHPYLAAAIVGAALNAEEQVAAGLLPPEKVTQLKKALGPPFAAIGDGFYWLALRPAAALLAALCAPLVGLWSLLVFLLLYNLGHVAGRVWLFRSGYRLGPGVVGALGRLKAPAATLFLKMSSAVMAGVLASQAALSNGAGGKAWHGLLVGCVTVGAVLLLPKVRFAVALYLALLLGLLAGGSIL
jgi:mannose PTS system EIID component